MILDETASDPAFRGGRTPDHIDVFVAWLHSRMNVTGDREWRIISARRKSGKELVEIEESGPEGTFRMIAKSGKPHRVKLNYEGLRALWSAGFRPPQELTVPEPIAYFPERHVLVQEKAPGVDLLTRVLNGQGEQAAHKAARWLAAVHGMQILCDQGGTTAERLAEQLRELESVVDERQSMRVRDIGAVACAIIGPALPELVPAHGDFHPMNILMADSGRVTGIDLDKFCWLDRTEEVAYALAQLACIGFHRVHSFDASLSARQSFLTSYESASGRRLDRALIAAHIAITILTNLHFDLCAMDTGRTALLDPWLRAAEACLAGHIHFSDPDEHP